MTTKVTKRGTLEILLSDQDDGISVKWSLDKENEQQILEVNTSENSLSCDVADIVAFCVHTMGIPESQMSLERLKQVGWTLEEVEAATTHLEVSGSITQQTKKRLRKLVQPWAHFRR